MNDARFWKIIEGAWASVRGGKSLRAKAMAAADPQDYFAELPGALQRALLARSAGDVVALATIFKQKMYELDTEKLARHTPFGDDGVMDARAFVIGMGRDYYEAVRADPTRHNRQGQSERMFKAIDTALQYHACASLASITGPSMGTRSNPAGWPALAAERAREDAFKMSHAELLKLKERHRISDGGNGALRLTVADDATIALTVLGLSMADAEDLLGCIEDWRRKRR